MLLVEVSSEEVGPIRQLWLGRFQYDGVDAMVVLEVVDLSRKHQQWDEQVGGMGRGHWPMGSRRRRWGERYD
jgi:hypothetical protein